jgi:hypothetical protein
MQALWYYETQNTGQFALECFFKYLGTMVVALLDPSWIYWHMFYPVLSMIIQSLYA